MLKSFFDKLFEEVLFVILLIVLLIVSFFEMPSLASIDWRVIAALFNLMLVAIAFENLNFLDALAIRICGRFHSERRLAYALIGTSMLLSMWMTNDVALLTLVPLTLLIGKKGSFNPFRLIAIETVAANVGSSLTPFGNPQNIYLFNRFSVQTLDFVQTSSHFVVPAAVLLLAVAHFCSKDPIAFDLSPKEITGHKKLWIYGLLFVGVILSILHLLPWQWMTLIVILLVLALDRDYLLKVDYFLLGTFVLFFLVIDVVGGLEALKQLTASLIQQPVSTLWVSAILSQGISNVPAAILLSPFVSDYKPLLIGVSLGGMGTMIASLANLIAYKLYQKVYPKNIYLKYFTKVNVLLFVICGGLMTIVL